MFGVAINSSTYDPFLSSPLLPLLRSVVFLLVAAVVVFFVKFSEVLSWLKFY